MTDKKAIVTGASEGIGKAITLALAREGVDVAICARRKEPLEQTAAEIAKATGRKIIPITADLTNPADAESFIKKAHVALGRIDILVNNAGSAPGGVHRAFERRRLGERSAIQIHGLRALHEARSADHAEAEEGPRRQSDRQRRR